MIRQTEEAFLYTIRSRDSTFVHEILFWIEGYKYYHKTTCVVSLSVPSSFLKLNEGIKFNGEVLSPASGVVDLDRAERKIITYKVDGGPKVAYRDVMRKLRYLEERTNNSFEEEIEALREEHIQKYGAAT